MAKRGKKQMEKITIEEQSKRISEGIKLFLQIIGLFGVISSIVYTGMEFYIDTVKNDAELKKEIVVKGGEILNLNESLKENFKEHQEIKDKIVEIHSDVKLIRALLEVKKVKDHKGLATFIQPEEIYQSVERN